tara:strand:+ start:153 stop:470 length:318 start_codon:yes stop_codon:yes gene_type:complete
MTISNLVQIFYTLLYLVTGVLIVDVVFYLLVAPILYDYPYWVYLDYGVNQNKLLFLSVGFLIVVCVLLRTPNKSFLGMIYNNHTKISSMIGVFLFTSLLFSFLFL